MTRDPTPMLAFLSRALLSARTNAAWPALRPLGELLAAASPTRAGALGPPAAVDAHSGLPPYELWARLKADQTVAREEAPNENAESVESLRVRAPSSPAHSARLLRRSYHDALRAQPLVRLGDLDVAVRSPLPHGGRRVLAVLDKAEVDGVLVRLTAELSLDKNITDRALFEVLFAHSRSAVERTLCALLGVRGVREVERVARGAVDLCGVASGGVVPDELACLRGVDGASVCAFAYATCALDVSEGNNDLFAHDAPSLRELAHEHLEGRVLPHRVFRDRKLVVTAAAASVMKKLASARGTKTVCYEVATS